MDWHQAITRWTTWLAAGGASPDTLRLRRLQLRRIGADIGGHPFTTTDEELTMWFALHQWAPETRRSHLAAVRSFYRWAVDHGHATVDPTRLLPRPHPTPAEPRPASEQAVDRALAAADDRQRLMVELAARHGLRRGEISRIHSDDLIGDAGDVLLAVHGKGGKDRVIPLLDRTAAALRRNGPGWIFPNGKGSHLSPGHVGVLITRALPPGVTPHMLRHRFATVVYRATLDIRNLQRLLGHASVATTQRYAAADPAELRRVLSAAA